MLASLSRELVEAGSNIEQFAEAAIRESAAALLDLQMFSTNAGDADPPSRRAPWCDQRDGNVSFSALGYFFRIGALVQALANYGGGLKLGDYRHSSAGRRA